MEENANHTIEFNGKSNISPFIKHEYEIIIDNKYRNWTNADIKALEEQCINDINIFYNKLVKMRQSLIDSWIITLLNNNNNHQVRNLAIEFKKKSVSNTYTFYADAITDEKVLKIRINYDN